MAHRYTLEFYLETLAVRLQMPLTTAIVYGMGAMASASGGNDGKVIVFYGQTLGVRQDQVTLALGLSSLLGVLIDPVIAVISDHLKTPLGRRHPLMYGAMIPAVWYQYQLWHPPREEEPSALFSHLLGSMILLKLFLSGFEVPSGALINELAPETHDRTVMMSLRYLFGWICWATLTSISFFVLLRPSDKTDNGFFNEDGYRAYGTLAASVSAVSMLVSAIGTHPHVPDLALPAKAMPAPRGIIDEVRNILQIHNARTVLASSMLSSWCGGVSSGLFQYFLIYLFKFSTNQAGVIVLLSGPAVIGSMRLSTYAGRAWGKKTGVLRLAWLDLFIKPLPLILAMVIGDGTALFVLTIPLMLVSNTLGAAQRTIGASLSMDLADEANALSGSNSEALFYSVISVSDGTVHSLGMFAAGLFLRAVSFSQTAGTSEETDVQVHHLAWLFISVSTPIGMVALRILSAYRPPPSDGDDDPRLSSLPAPSGEMGAEYGGMALRGRSQRGMDLHAAEGMSNPDEPDHQHHNPRRGQQGGYANVSSSELL